MARKYNCANGLLRLYVKEFGRIQSYSDAIFENKLNTQNANLIRIVTHHLYNRDDEERLEKIVELIKSKLPDKSIREKMNALVEDALSSDEARWYELRTQIDVAVKELFPAIMDRVEFHYNHKKGMFVEVEDLEKLKIELMLQKEAIISSLDLPYKEQLSNFEKGERCNHLKQISKFNDSVIEFCSKVNSRYESSEHKNNRKISAWVSRALKQFSPNRQGFDLSLLVQIIVSGMAGLIFYTTPYSQTFEKWGLKSWLVSLLVTGAVFVVLGIFKRENRFRRFALFIAGISAIPSLSSGIIKYSENSDGYLYNFATVASSNPGNFYVVSLILCALCLVLDYLEGKKS